MEEASASIGRSGIKGLRGSTPPGMSGQGSGGKFSFGKGLGQAPRSKNSPSSLLRHQCHQGFGHSSGLPHHSGGGTPSLFLGGGGGGKKGQCHLSRHDSPRGGQEAGGIEIQDDTMNTADGDDQFEPDLDLRRESAEAIETVILSGEHQ